MEKFVAIAAWLALSLFVTFQANRLAQRVFPTTAAQTAERRYLYGLIVRLIGIAAFMIMVAAFVGATILFGFATW
ncbi:MAG: hypothetical protein HY056_12265 [Proteobacteria bacterium]|nr:hypothetical protein [Pseudomonadota bacterium]